MFRCHSCFARRALCTGVAALAFALPWTAVQAESGRQQALTALEQPDTAVRIAAIEQLAATGTMEDAPRLVPQLRDADEAVHARAASAMWEIWSRSGDPDLDALLQHGLEQLSRGEFDLALATFDEVVARRPDFAEGWNKRATAWFLLDRPTQSLKDCDETLKRNPLHFGAMSGAALIHLHFGRLDAARGYLARALQIHPHLAGARELHDIVDSVLRRRSQVGV